MKAVFRMVGLAVLAAFGVWLWLVLFPGPEKVIRQRLAGLAHAVSFSAHEGELARLAGAQSLAGFLATNIEVNIDLPGRLQHDFLDREEILQAALGARSSGMGLKVSFLDVSVKFAPDQQSAVASLTLVANVSGERDAIVQQMKFTVQKTDGKWVITRVETVRTLS